MSLNPKIWGPHAWIFLHSVTLAYPECPTDKDKENMMYFFDSLKAVLPCFNCRTNLAMHMNKHPLTDDILNSKKALVNWLVNIHNEVNIMTNKPVMDLHDFLIMYNKMYSHKESIWNKIMIIIICLILLVSVLVMVYYRKYR